jgi:tetratricopeptide (TPR) repeat protein
MDQPKKIHQRLIHATWGQMRPGDRKIVMLFIAFSMVLTLIISTLAIYGGYQEYQNNPIRFLDSLDMTMEEGGFFADSQIQVIPAEDLFAHRDLVDIYTQSGDWNRTLGHIQRISPYFSEDLEFQTKAGRAFLSMGQPSQALDYLRKALEISPNEPILKADMGLALLRMNRPDEARAYLQEALQRHPGNPHIETRLATVFAELSKNDPRADSLFRKVLAAFPNHAEAYYQYSRLHMNRGNFGSAKGLLETMLRKEPMNSRAHARLGMVYYYLHQDQQSEDHYRTALTLSEQDFNTWYNLGELYLDWANKGANSRQVQINRQKAIYCYLEALKFNPHHHAAHTRVGLLLLLNNQYQEAIQHLQTALKGNPKNEQILIQIALSFEKLDQPQRALEYLRLAHDAAPLNRVISEKLKSFMQKQMAGS